MEATDAKAVGARLAALREQLGLKGVDISRLTGIPQSRWSEYESGKRRVIIDAAIVLHRHFNVSLDWLFLGVMPSSLLALPQASYEPVDPMLLSIWRGMNARERKKLVQMALHLSSK